MSRIIRIDAAVNTHIENHRHVFAIEWGRRVTRGETLRQLLGINAEADPDDEQVPAWVNG